MSAHKFRNSWWVDFRSNGKRYRLRSPDNSRAGSATYETLLRSKLVRGESIDLNNKKTEFNIITFGEFANKWFETYVQTNNKPSEQKAKKVLLNVHLIPYFGKHLIDRITNLQVEEYKSAKLKYGLTPKTINNHLAVLRKCLNCAQDWLDIKHLPKIKPLAIQPPKTDFLTLEETQKLLSVTDSPKWYAMILLALHTGLRFGEILGLEWQDVDLDKRLLTVRRSIVNGITGTPKNNRERTIPLTNDLCYSLRTIQRPAGAIFNKTDGRHILYQDSPRRVLNKLCRKAGLREISWHKLRHTFASHLVALGVPLIAVQQLLGHSDIRMTMRYSHLTQSNLIDAINVLDSSKIENFGQQVGNALIPSNLQKQ